MANTYITTTVEVTTTGSNVIFFTSPSGGCIVRNVMIYAKSNHTTVTINYDDRTTDVAIHKATLSTDELWEPFSTPLGMPASNFLKMNTSEAVNVLITYVEFT